MPDELEWNATNPPNIHDVELGDWRNRSPARDVGFAADFGMGYVTQQ